MQNKKIISFKYQNIKLFMDILFAFIGLIVLSPLFLLISILIYKMDEIFMFKKT